MPTGSRPATTRVPYDAGRCRTVPGQTAPLGRAPLARLLPAALILATRYRDQPPQLPQPPATLTQENLTPPRHHPRDHAGQDAGAPSFPELVLPRARLAARFALPTGSRRQRHVYRPALAAAALFWARPLPAAVTSTTDARQVTREKQCVKAGSGQPSIIRSEPAGHDATASSTAARSASSNRSLEMVMTPSCPTSKRVESIDSQIPIPTHRPRSTTTFMRRSPDADEPAQACWMVVQKFS